MTDLGRVLWQACHTLRHEGVAYDEYIDQLSLLLFLKMANEMGAEVPAGTSWDELVTQDDESLLDNYQLTLKTLSGEPGILGDIFSQSQSHFRTSAGLREILALVDATEWAQLDQDVQGSAFEYLLERTASEGKQGAGQYFTPRPLVRAIVRCIQPGMGDADSNVVDPAVGSAGFLVEAHRWLKEADPERTRQVKYIGNEIVPRVRRLGLMNLHLHGVEDFHISLGDALGQIATEGTYDVVITNPPFGSRRGSRPQRPSFWLHTGNKQVNFVQHVALGLKERGRAAIVVPDNCFSGDSTTAALWAKVLTHNRVHTVLRLPKGTFSPYTSGIMTNVVFMTAGEPTSDIWVYDARSNSRVPTARKPLAEEELSDFVSCYGTDPHGRSPRSAGASPQGRWTRRSISELERASYRLDATSSSGIHMRQDERRSQDLLMKAEADLELALNGIRELRRLMRGHE